MTTHTELLKELQRGLRGPLINKDAKEAVQQTIEAEYACGSRILAAALAYLLNTEDRHRKVLAKIEDALKDE